MAFSGADAVAGVQTAVRAVLDRSGLTQDGRSLVVAVSGGADSTCLLDALVHVLPDATDRLVVGHVDHRLRLSSADDAAYVMTVAKGYGLRGETLVVDVPVLMTEERRGLEDAARVGRYRALRELCREVGSVAVVTGHTRDDSVETVLMHLLRGTGRTGLGGMADVVMLDALADGTVRAPHAAVFKAVRPLLRIGRSETVAYCQAVAIPWLTDPTNADPALVRNRVRGHLLPVLRTYNPAIDEGLDRLAQLMRDEDEYLDALTEQQHRRLVRTEDGRARIALAEWTRLPRVLQRRLVRRIAEERGVTDLSRDAVERALAVGHDRPVQAELGQGLIVRRQWDDTQYTLVFERTQKGTL